MNIVTRHSSRLVRPAFPWASMITLALSANALAAEQGPAAPSLLPEVSVTATRVERENFGLPLSIDTVNAKTIHEGRAQVNLSEALNAVPGIVVQNRQNYAQDLQISSRGFGARSAFGVRGLRLIADGIPATMPDGQGQAASFNLDTAERIEVLRGPFASMYGNAAGGVIQIFTADGPPQPTLTGRFNAGSFDTTKWAAQYGAQHGPLNLNAVTSVFRTDGFRDHSAARRDHSHAKLKLDGGSAGTFTLIADALDQPETQDPLGLTRAQVAQNRRQAPAVAFQFDTRKSVSQSQVGLVHDYKIGARDSLQARAYVGDRQVTQHLSIPIAVQTGSPTHSGGVVDLDRGFGGAGVRWTHGAEFAGTALDLHVGLDFERMVERRRGFINNLGVTGVLRRDEDNTVQSTDAYAQAEWRLLDPLLIIAGVRHSRVRFESQDSFIAPGNPDDSGAVRYVRTSPAVGASYAVSPAVSVYANVGKGFETPTFAELAYTPSGAPGLNFALRPAISTTKELGTKFRLSATSRATVAVYRVDVADEIVVATNVGGRQTFRNASRTRRDGVELGWQGQFGRSWEAAVAYTHLKARFTEPFTAAGAAVPAGNRLPGVPANTLYGELVWRHQASGFHAGAEARHNSKVFVDDANSDAAESYTIVNLRVGFEQRFRQWRFSEFVRVDNVTNKAYIGSVIVADGNARFYEPAPGRNWLAGITAQLSF